MQAEMALNLFKRKGQGSLSVKQPRFSGLQGESLDLAARWSGDVVLFKQLNLNLFWRVVLFSMIYAEFFLVQENE